MQECRWCGDPSTTGPLCERCAAVRADMEARAAAYPYAAWLADLRRLEAARDEAHAARVRAAEVLAQGDARRERGRDRAVAAKIANDRHALGDVQKTVPRGPGAATRQRQADERAAVEAAEAAWLEAARAVVDHRGAWSAYSYREESRRYPLDTPPG